MIPYLIAALSSVTVLHANPLPFECTTPSVKNKAIQCVGQLSPMLTKLNTAKDLGFYNQNITKDINDLCAAAVDCFSNLQNCASIDKALVLNMGGVCDLYGFMNGKFQDCMGRLDDAIQRYSCVRNFFMDPVYTDSKTSKIQCNSLKNDGKCVKQRVEAYCSKNKAKEFEDHLDGQLKRFDC